MIIRKTSDLSKSDCSLHPTYADNGILFTMNNLFSYRDEIVQGRVQSETASFDKI